MELNGSDLLGPMTDAGHRPVVEMPVRDLKISGQTRLIDCIPMILGRDEDTAAPQVLNGLIRTAMPEF